MAEPNPNTLPIQLAAGAMHNPRSIRILDSRMIYIAAIARTIQPRTMHTCGRRR